MFRLPVLVLGLTALLFPGPFAQDIRARELGFRVEPVAGPFAFPWSVAWLADGTPVVSARDGALWLVRGHRNLQIAGVPRVATGGQGGLFDVLILAPTGGRQDLLLSYAWKDVDGRSLRVSRFTLGGNDDSGWRLATGRTLFDLLPRSAGPIQYGGRLGLLPDGTLLVATGDRGVMARAQDPADGAGKIHRINLDGTVPADNPFVDKPGWQPSIWTLGHRNIQGLWVEPGTGRVWATEHGPMGGDEVNRILPGRNYGWPVITYGVNYGSGTKIGEGFEKTGMEQPILYWKPSIAPSGFIRYDGDRFPKWKGSFFSGALAGQGLSRFRISDGPAVASPADRATIPPHPPAYLVEEEYLLAGILGRIRDVRTGPDGLIYLTTDSPQGRLYRLIPPTSP